MKLGTVLSACLEDFGDMKSPFTSTHDKRSTETSHSNVAVELDKNEIHLGFHIVSKVYLRLLGYTS
jgi:hypothetical protein